MGQYYSIDILTEKTSDRFGTPAYEFSAIVAHDYGCGVKLMEFAYDGADPVKAALLKLDSVADSDGRAYMGVIGDYATEGHVEAGMVGLPAETAEKRRALGREMLALRNGTYVREDQFRYRDYPSVFANDFTKEYTIVNEDKGEYLYAPFDIEDGRNLISTLMLFCAVGNGMGGGDYRGTDRDLVGRWAFNRLAVYRGRKDFPELFLVRTEFSED